MHAYLTHPVSVAEASRAQHQHLPKRRKPVARVWLTEQKDRDTRRPLVGESTARPRATSGRSAVRSAPGRSDGLSTLGGDYVRSPLRTRPLVTSTTFGRRARRWWHVAVRRGEATRPEFNKPGATPPALNFNDLIRSTVVDQVRALNARVAASSQRRGSVSRTGHTSFPYLGVNRP